MSSGRTVALGLLLAFLVATGAADRRKRELRFPKGSSLSTAVALTSYLPKGITDGFAHVLEFDFGFPFPEHLGFGKTKPNEKSTSSRVNERKKWKVKRNVEDEERRDLLFKLENSINRVGVNGSACLFRLICEVQRLGPPSSLLEEVLVALLGAPAGGPRESCKSNLESCPVSLLHVALHSQRVPPPGSQVLF